MMEFVLFRASKSVTVGRLAAAKKLQKNVIKSKPRFATGISDIFEKQLRTAELLEMGEGGNP